MFALVAAILTVAAPDLRARPVRALDCEGGPCLEVRFMGATSTRLVLGPGVAESLRKALPRHGERALEAVAEALELAVKKRRLRPAALRVAGALADAGTLPLVREEPGVRVEGPTASRLRRIAERYFRTTGRRLTVTSGTRTPLEQAEAMSAKVRFGGSLGIYKNRDVVRALRNAAKQARRAGLGRSGAVKAMAEIIEAELRRGNPISRHLVRGAVDLRTIGLSTSDRHALRAAIAAEPGVSFLVERRPPHLHLSFD